MKDRQISRRSFGKASAGAAAALALGGASRTAGAQDQVTISMLTDLPMPAVVEAFMAANPDIVVEIEEVSFNEVFQQNQVRLGSGSATPDVIAVDAPLVTSYGLRGWLEPLDDAFDEAARSALVPELIESGTYDGKLIAPPIWNSSQLLFYNEDMLTAAGVTPPAADERWTWDQLAEAARAVTRDDIFGFQFEQFDRIYQLQPLPQGLGVPVISEDGLSVTGIVDSPEWVEAFTYYKNLHNEWAVSPKGQIEVEELFINQKLAMCIRGPWAVKSLADADLPFSWKAAPHPMWEGGEICVPTDSWHLGVNPLSENKEAAIRFIQYCASEEAGRIWYDAGASWPAQTALLQEIIDSPDNADWPFAAYPVAAREAEYARPRPLTPGYNEYQDLLGTAFENIRNGGDVQEELSGAAGRIDREMRKYQ